MVRNNQSISVPMRHSNPLSLSFPISCAMAVGTTENWNGSVKEGAGNSLFVRMTIWQAAEMLRRERLFEMQVFDQRVWERHPSKCSKTTTLNFKRAKRGWCWGIPLPTPNPPRPCREGWGTPNSFLHFQKKKKWLGLFCKHGHFYFSHRYQQSETWPFI